MLKHHPYFHVGQFQNILCFPPCYIELIMHCPQISARKQQTPHSFVILIQLVEYDLFIECGAEGFSPQQTLHRHLDFRASLPDQSANQTVAAGICPIDTYSSFIKIINNGPWIINISPISECESVIPVFYLLFLIRQSIFFQCCKYFLFRKPKTLFISFRSRCHYSQIVQIRKDRLFTDPRNACHNSAFQTGIRLKCRIEQTSGKFHQFLPIPVHICFLHRRIILVQKDDHLLAIISAQIIGKYFQ